VTAYSPEVWESFFVANAGAAAALAGLVFVGVSINVDEIIASGRLVGRALEAFTTLSCVLIVAAIGLAPGIGTTGFGIALLVIGLVLELVVGYHQWRSLPRFGGESGDAVPRGSDLVRIVAGQIGVVSFVVAGITLVAESGGGLYWLVPAVAIGYAASLTNAWVLLIEIRR
jgi:modulator of FtsH protease